MQLINVKALDEKPSGKGDLQKGRIEHVSVRKWLVGHCRFNQEFPDAYNESCTLAYRPLHKVDGGI